MLKFSGFSCTAEEACGFVCSIHFCFLEGNHFEVIKATGPDYNSVFPSRATLLLKGGCGAFFMHKGEGSGLPPVPTIP
eukprot:NODE_2156_length_1188_cov_46310.661106_g1788_i0.p1 GENE.NODE_2156_length_1188_cov_46310.661106_g1788_i0~~NODE_2156_length_1188_cov_46310.661106_g1788_i0.p1  ORF type:complete len:78 (+),score=2.39 NODE_2156_length_1188_cov_46310.661106_g1788_i0:291-524(+)